MWNCITNTDDLISGDIIEIPSKIPLHSVILPGTVVEFVKHYGVILELDGQLMVVDNPFLGTPRILPLDDIIKDRKIERIIRTNVNNTDLINRWYKLKDKPYSFLHFNCEDFVRHITGREIGFDQRIGWAIGVFVVVVVIVVIWQLARRR